MSVHVARPALWPEIRITLIAAIAIFAYTIGIGILNGTDIVDFDRRRILGHVHGGTLGWLTLAVYAASMWLFGELRTVSARERTFIRWMVGLSIVSFVAYIVAFSTTYGNWRPVIGVVALVAIVLFTGWVLWRSRGATLGVPHLGFLAAMGTSVVGGVLGVLLGLDIANSRNWLPDGGEDAHPATMVVGFLVPVTFGMIEWAFHFPSPPRFTRLGAIQMVFPFLGGIILMLALLLDVTALAPIAILLQVIGVGIFVYRMWGRFRQVEWLTANPERHAVLATVGLLFVIGLAQYFVIRHEGDFDLVPTHQILALDHSQFIGATTNAVLAMLLAATVVGARGNRLDDIILVLVNVGIAGFAVSLLADSTPGKRTFAPIMGTGLLLAMGLYAWRLWQSPEGPARSEG